MNYVMPTPYSPINSVAMDIAFMQASEGLSKEEATLKANDKRVLQDMAFRIHLRKCKAEGHAWQDNSYAGPESGMTCRRCGARFHHQLY
jgi:hypothetical protein